MIIQRRPLFEVVTAALATARGLTTAANVRGLINSPIGDDTLMTTLIDRVSALMARYCKLASDAAGTMPTFAQEACRATWASLGYVNPFPYQPLDEPSRLVLPWRKPVAITGITEDGVALVPGTDFRLMPGGILERLDGNGAPKLWSYGIVIATFNGGFVLPTNVPPDLEAAAIEQVKYLYASRARDPSLRSETIPDIYQGSYGVAGGASIGDSGLLASVEGMLAPYKNWAQG